MTVRIGLTGGIGSGKSTVAALFAQHGVTILDSDLISHQLTQAGGEAIEAIRREFGERYIADNGAMDRVRMRQRVFSDKHAKENLEAILHPLIFQRMLGYSEQGAAPYLLLVIPLLFETGNYLPHLKRIAVVDCCETTQISRTLARSGLTEPEVCAIIAQQVSRNERLQRANDIINNDDDVNALRLQIPQLHRQYSDFAKELIDEAQD